MSVIEVSSTEGFRYLGAIVLAVPIGVLIPENLRILGLASAVISVLLLFLLNKPAVRVRRGLSILVFFIEIVIPAFYTHYVVQALQGSSTLDTMSDTGIATRMIDWSDLGMAVAMLVAAVLVFVLRKISDYEKG